MYEYNSDGLRTFRRGNNTNYYYYYDGDRLIAQKWGTKYLLFHYDESDSIYGITYYSGSGSPVKYNLYKNLQGDVVEIRSKYNALLATYNYDAWGNVVSITNSSGAEITDTTHIAHINPIRYRSYYYDDDTGFYYLQSRYYDPAIGRFISADEPTIAIDPLTVTDKNLFAYCDNNPVKRFDDSGYFWESPFDVFTWGASIVEVALNPGDPLAWAGLVGDTIDLIPFVTGIGEGTRAIKITVKTVDNVADVIDEANDLYRGVDYMSDIRISTGSYEILYENGYNYVGKGGFGRAINSAMRYTTDLNRPVSISWKSSIDHITAYIDEYYMQHRAGGVLSSNKELRTFNKIWSPGRNYIK